MDNVFGGVIGHVLGILIISLIIAFYWYIRKIKNYRDGEIIKFSIDTDDIDYEKMMRKTEKMIAFNPDIPEPYKLKGILLMKKAKYNYAIINLNKYLYYCNKENTIENPNDYNEILLKRGLCYYHLNNYEDSIKDLENVQSLFDSNTQKIYNEMKSKF